MPVHYIELKVGDRVRRAIDRLQKRPPATVTHIEDWYATDFEWFPTTFKSVCASATKRRKSSSCGTASSRLPRNAPASCLFVKITCVA